MAWMDSILNDSDNKSSSSGKNSNSKGSMSSSSSGGSNSASSGGNTQITDKDIAMDMLSMSKGDIEQLGKAITETTNPQLRLTLTNQLSSAINSHFRLSDMAMKKGWYDAKTCPTQLINQDLGEFQGIKLQQQASQQSIQQTAQQTMQ